MVLLIKTTTEYLYETKQDVFFLELKNQGKTMMYDRDSIENKKSEEFFTSWFKDRNIQFAMTGPDGLLCGWMGHYYIKFSGWDDPVLKEFSDTFENSDGGSKEPSNYQLFVISYDKWVEDGKLAEYEQHLIDREDPNYGW